MIVSASYRTDIPAFFAPWFMNRLAAGYARVVNPYGGPAATVSLRPEDVDGFVFWTRNIAPLLPHLAEVRAVAPFVVQYTVTGYPRALDARTPPAVHAIAAIRRLAADWGGRAVVWRYDPIIVSDLTPPAWHRETFRRLADALAGAVDEAVVSFVEPYRKTRRNLDRAALAHGFAWADPPAAEKEDLIAGLAAEARQRGMALTVCTQPGLTAAGARPARCIDAVRLGDVGGRPLAAPEKGNRPGCRCALSRDIGAYDTCPHGCVYCYAVAEDGRARRRQRAHDPAGDYLAPPPLATPTMAGRSSRSCST